MTLTATIRLSLALCLSTIVVSASPNLVSNLHVRQSGVPNIPAQCAVTCDAPNTLIAANCTIAQCCTTQFETEYFQCLQCVGMAANLTDYTPAQALITNLTLACEAGGVTLPDLFFNLTTGAEISSAVIPASTSSSVSTSLTSPTIVSQATITTAPSPPPFTQITVGPAVTTANATSGTQNPPVVNSGLELGSNLAAVVFATTASLFFSFK